MRISFGVRQWMVGGLALTLVVGFSHSAKAQTSTASLAVTSDAHSYPNAPQGQQTGEQSPNDITSPAVHNQIKQMAKAIVKIPPQLRAAAQRSDDLFKRASAAFPSFCSEWGHKLRMREINNISKLGLQLHDGWETGTYLGYSEIKTCFTKRSTGGVPIGELTYQEIQYYVTGRTSEEARHNVPKAVSFTNTTEIFRWDRTKWSYE